MYQRPKGLTTGRPDSVRLEFPNFYFVYKLLHKAIPGPSFGRYKPIPFEYVLTILVSIFLLLPDERKGRESVRLKWREKREREREAFDPNGIGLITDKYIKLYLNSINNILIIFQGYPSWSSYGLQ